MLIHLVKQEYLPALDGLAADEGFADFVSTLGEALAAGAHAIDAPPLLLERFAAWSDLSRRQREALAHAARERVRPSIPLAAATDRLVITGPAGPSSEPDAPGWHRRPWQTFRQSGTLPATTLAGENIADACWYLWLARAWSARRNPGAADPGLEVALIPRGVGGSTARDELPAALGHGQLTCCILDSDKNHPKATEGETARQLRRALGALPPDATPWHLEVIAARDLENLLPLGVVEAIGDGCAWLAPMRARGFFVAADRPVDPDLAWVDIGKDQCAERLRDTRDPATRALRERVAHRLRAADASCTAAAACGGQVGCRAQSRTTRPDGIEVIKWATVPEDCRHVWSVGKLIGRACDHLDALDRRPGRSAAKWLAARLPPTADDPAVWDPARRAWSWGLRLRPLIRSRER